METWQIVGMVLYCIPVAIGLFLAFVGGIRNGALTGDYSSSGTLAWLNFFKAFILISVAAIIWPISIPIFSVITLLNNRKMEKRNAEYEARLAEGFNYGKVYRITNVHEFLSRHYKVGQLVKIVTWDDEKPFVQAVGTPLPGYDINFRFYWSLDNMQAV